MQQDGEEENLQYLLSLLGKREKKEKRKVQSCLKKHSYRNATKVSPTLHCFHWYLFVLSGMSGKRLFVG